MRRLPLFSAALAFTVVAPFIQTAATADGREFLEWNAGQAQKIGQEWRVNGRVGGLLDFRVVHTEHSYNYKLRATWLNRDVIWASARLAQLRDIFVIERSRPTGVCDQQQRSAIWSREHPAAHLKSIAVLSGTAVLG